jgi:hypothetical protein
MAAKRALHWWAGAVVVVAAVSGCVYYDSRWLQNAAEKKRAEARLHPAALGSDRPHTGLGRVALVRAYATRAYAAETINWEEQFDTLLADASRVLEPALGITLENGGTNLWEPETGEAEPTAAIDALAKQDSGEGVHWVAGFLQSVPKLVTDYHRLGVGRLLSKYMVLRGSADPAELDALGKFDGVNEAERQKIYSERRRHKIVAVFLHELGHTLGATHRTERRTLMSPTYDPNERGFDDATLGLLKVTLPHHLSGVPYRAAPSALAYLEKDDGGWVGSDREGWMDTLKRLAPPTRTEHSDTPNSLPPIASAPPIPAPEHALAKTTPVPFTTMTRQDRSTYDKALAAEKTEDSRVAWDMALPLFDAYPRVVEVQELRCRLAKERHFISGVVYVHCSRLEALGKPTE